MTGAHRTEPGATGPDVTPAAGTPAATPATPPAATPPAATPPAEPARPAHGERSPEELRGDIEELRGELGDTVEELAHRVDVPARVRAKRDETTEQVREQVVHAREVLAEKAPAVENAMRERPALVGGIALVLSYLFFSRLRKRRNRRHRSGAR